MGLCAGSALAQAAPDQPAPDQSKPAAAADSATPAAAAPASWLSTVKPSIHFEGGGTFNAQGPDDGLNFGRLFDDKANTGLLNQAMIGVERDIDPKDSGFQVGFKLQGMYGSDARYTHLIGQLDHDLTTQNQFDLIEANLQFHVPFLTKGGMEIKAGQYSTPIGNEVIDATGNFFYSHSYIFNFGIPLKHTGFYTTTHVNSVLDIYAGLDTGVNTWIGRNGGNNDNRIHFLGGFGLNLGKLTVLALTHIGPELPSGALGPGVRTHGYDRYLNDAVITYKFNDKFTSITELNYIRDDGVQASGGGVAQYFTYVITPEITLGLRGEVWRDNEGYFVAAFPGNNDFLYAEEGLPNGSYGVGPKTYGAITFGMNFKPAHLPKAFDGFVLRPELRYDRTLAGGDAFNHGVSRDQFTVGIDAILPINF